jgi:LmbE family N-acetylglucosaminyl deacetylase
MKCRAGLLLATLVALPCAAQVTPLQYDDGPIGLGLALRRLPTAARVLYVTAHPDDENNALLVKLSRGLGLRTALLTATRGDGGQNEIGPELFQAIGILRTEELMNLHRYDGVEQYFTRAYEFGYSFSVEETYEKWGKEETLGDIVKRIRIFRPDVILTMAREAEGGGQHHQASARLAHEAFRVAADPNSFPEQLKAGLRRGRRARSTCRRATPASLEAASGSPPRARCRRGPASTTPCSACRGWSSARWSGAPTAVRGRASCSVVPATASPTGCSSTASRRSLRASRTSSRESTRRCRACCGWSETSSRRSPGSQIR